MCHLLCFCFLPWWKCPGQPQEQLQNVWDFILPRVRSRNFSQNVEIEQSVSKAPKIHLREQLSELPLSYETMQSLYWFGFPHQCLRVLLGFTDSCVLWQSASPKCCFPAQYQSKFILLCKSWWKGFLKTNFLLKKQQTYYSILNMMHCKF